MKSVETDSRRAVKLYRANITAGSLLIRESRRIAELLLQNESGAKLIERALCENVLQKRSRMTAVTQANLIIARLRTVDETLWRMIAAGDGEIVRQALLVAAIKHNRLLGDFMRGVLRSKFDKFEREVTRLDWETFFEESAQREPHILRWSQSTQNKLREVIYRTLAEALYLSNTRRPRLEPVLLATEVRSYLNARNESYVLRCMDFAA